MPCPCPGSSPLCLSSISSPHSDPNERRNKGQHRNQRERWITSAKNAVPKQCPNQSPDTVDKGHYAAAAAAAGFMVQRASCLVHLAELTFLLRDSGNPKKKKKKSCEKFSAEEKRLIGHSGQLRSLGLGSRGIMGHKFQIDSGSWMVRARGRKEKFVTPLDFVNALIEFRNMRRIR